MANLAKTVELFVTFAFAGISIASSEFVQFSELKSEVIKMK